MITPKQYSQIWTEFIAKKLERIYVKQNNFIAGEIDHSKKIFYSVPRSAKNVFHLFHNDPGGLGINEEILLRNDFDIIKIKYCDRVLTTTRLKWLNLGVTSPFCNERIDKQIILKLSLISMNDTKQFEPQEKQTELFAEVI